jgi:hypothetical protein
MFIVGLVSWWYGAGWRQRVSFAGDQLASVYDYFSVDLLLRTMFSPFRQISAGSVKGPIGVQLRAWFDQLISRTIGFFVRTLIIMVGSITLFLTACLQIIFVVLWALVPLAPIAGIVMALGAVRL